jgi:hypothetical protein
LAVRVGGPHETRGLSALWCAGYRGRLTCGYVLEVPLIWAEGLDGSHRFALDHVAMCPECALSTVRGG